MPKIISNKSSLDLNQPFFRPSLNCDFTQEYLDPRISFTRGSTATRVNRNRLIEVVPANQPRFDYDPVTGECKGLLIEESRTNLLTYSNDFTNASWTKTNVSVLPNNATAPDGSVGASKIVDNSTNYIHRIQRVTSKNTISSTYTFSIFVKSGESKVVEFGIGDTSVPNSYVDFFFNLNTTSFTSVTSSGTFSINSYGSIKYPNGWYRLYVVATTGTESTVTPFFGITNPSGSNSYRGDGNSGMYFWGAQFTLGSFSTSYIPTSGSQVTRSADVATISGTNFSSFYNSNEGSIFVSGTSNAQIISGTSRIFLDFNDNSTKNRQVVGFSSTSNTQFSNINSSTSSPTIITSASPGSGVKICVGYADTVFYNSSSFQMASNGQVGIQTGTSSSLIGISTSINQLNIGWDASSTTNANLNGTINRLMYYPRKLNDTQIENLTV